MSGLDNVIVSSKTIRADVDVYDLTVENDIDITGEISIPKTGSATLASGVKVVTPGVTLAAATFMCLVTGQASAANVVYSASWTSSTTFTIESSDASDTATVNYLILHV